MTDMPKPERRKKATFSQVNAILRLQNGVCTMCPAILADVSEPDVVYVKASFDVDHITPLDLLGRQTPDNLQCLCVPCHKLKTAIDIAKIAKGRRLRLECGQQARRAEQGSKLKSRNDFQRPLLPKSEDRETRSPDKASGFWKPKGPSVLSKAHRNYVKRGFGKRAVK